jgi:hypothetical protein
VLKNLLQELGAELTQRHGFRASGLSPQERRDKVFRQGISTRTLEMFIEWMDLFPEVAAFLKAKGAQWTDEVRQTSPIIVRTNQPGLRQAFGYHEPTEEPNNEPGESAPLVPLDVGPATSLPTQFRARIGQQWKLVELVEVKSAGQLMVKEVGVTAYGASAVITRDCVAPEHATLVAGLVAKAPRQKLKWPDGTPADGEQAPVEPTTK